MRKNVVTARIYVERVNQETMWIERGEKEDAARVLKNRSSCSRAIFDFKPNSTHCCCWFAHSHLLFTAGCRPPFANGVGPEISQLPNKHKHTCIRMLVWDCVYSLAMRRSQVWLWIQSWIWRVKMVWRRRKRYHNSIISKHTRTRHCASTLFDV